VVGDRLVGDIGLQDCAACPPEAPVAVAGRGPKLLAD
jgi:hypothetical protein